MISVNQNEPCVIVPRVSTGKQVEGTSLETQEEACIILAEKLNSPVYAIYREEGVSGALYLARRDLQIALSDIEEDRAKIFITYKVDRAGRDVDVIRAIAKRVTDAGGKIYFADEGGTETVYSGIGKAMLTMKGVFAEMERDAICERTTGGRRKKALQGQQPSRTVSPYGYHIVTHVDVLRGLYPEEEVGRYIIIEEEAKWVRDIFSRCLAGASLRGTANWLESAGVPTPGDGKFWRASTLRNILNNPVYKGCPAFGRRKYKVDETRLQRGMKRVRFPVTASDENIVPLTAPAIVEEETWGACQRCLADNRIIVSGNPNNRYVLSGLMYCPSCNRRMASATNKGNIYYNCPEDRPSRSASKRVCNPTRHRAEVVEPIVVRCIQEVARHPESVAIALRAYQKEKAATTSENADNLRKELETLDAKERATAEAQVQAIMAGRSTDVYDGLLADIGSKRQALQARLDAAVRGQRGATTTPATIAEKVARVLADVDEALTAPEITPAERNTLLRSVVNAVRPDDDGYCVALVPLSTGSKEPTSFSYSLPTVQMISMLCPPGASR